MALLGKKKLDLGIEASVSKTKARTECMWSEPSVLPGKASARKVAEPST